MNAAAPNPFYGDDLFVGRATALARVTGLLAQGQSTLLVAGRRAGKTTLARRVSGAALGRELVYADAGGWDRSSEGAALGSLLSEITGAPHDGAASRDAITEALTALGPVTLILDEADVLLLADWGAGFYAYLRYLDDTRLKGDISILMIGGPVLVFFHDPDDRGSPPLNTAEIEYLDPLDRDAVGELAALMPGVDGDLVMEYTGGQPWLTTRLLARVWAGAELEDAAYEVYDASAGVFLVWERQLRPGGQKFLRALPAEGLTSAQLRGPHWTRYRVDARIARAVGVVRQDGGRFRAGPSLFWEWFQARAPEEQRWDLAISYASEDDAVARKIHAQLRTEFRVFYAPEEDAALWGTDLNRVLPNIYGARARYVLVLSTSAYVKKYWTRVEYDEVAAKAPDRILLLDLGELPPDLPAGLVYRGSSPEELIGLISALQKKLAG